MIKIKLKDYEIEMLKSDSKGVLKNTYRVLEFATKTHQVFGGCLYSNYFDTEEEAQAYFDEHKEDEETRCVIAIPSQILETLEDDCVDFYKF